MPPDLLLRLPAPQQFSGDQWRKKDLVTTVLNQGLQVLSLGWTWLEVDMLKPPRYSTETYPELNGAQSMIELNLKQTQSTGSAAALSRLQ